MNVIVVVTEEYCAITGRLRQRQEVLCYGYPSEVHALRFAAICRPIPRAPDKSTVIKVWTERRNAE